MPRRRATKASSLIFRITRRAMLHQTTTLRWAFLLCACPRSTQRERIHTHKHRLQCTYIYIYYTKEKWIYGRKVAGYLRLVLLLLSPYPRVFAQGITLSPADSCVQRACIAFSSWFLEDRATTVTAIERVGEVGPLATMVGSARRASQPGLSRTKPF